MKTFFTSTLLLSAILFSSCNRKTDKQSDEQITIEQSDTVSVSSDSSGNSIGGNITMKQISTYPNNIVLTGLSNHRLVSVYRKKQKTESKSRLSSDYSYYDNDNGGEDSYEHFMPGIDILYGYNLLNIAHYDLKTEKGNFLFNHPVLVKTVYYPSFSQDSIEKKPINRNYYLVSVYDEDTNKDTILSKKDLRRFYHFDSSGVVKTMIVPADYSAMHSQYDSKNDVMYIFSRHDENKNGSEDDKEPIHIFWFNLKTPEKAKLLY